MNSSTILAKENTVINTNVDLLEDREVEDSIAEITLAGLLLLGREQSAAVGATVVLRAFEILE